MINSLTTFHPELKMEYREYNSAKDKKAVFRIWQESGWIDEQRGKETDKIMNAFMKSSSAYVAEVKDNAESSVLTTPGTIHYLNEDLKFCAVTGVATSRIARNRNFATELTALALADSAVKGTCVAGLGIFEQGFYNKLGFGNGPYEHWISFDPSNLRVQPNRRIPFRISLKDIKKIHKSRLSRLRGHGSVNLLPFESTQLDISQIKNGFGLGFYDEKSGELTHHTWIETEGENGPYSVHWMSYQNYDQFLELLSLLKSLSDQVYTVKMKEPPEIQIQDLLTKPFRYTEITRHGKHANYMFSSSYYQLRILNLNACITKTHLPKIRLVFNLQLNDPISDYLSKHSSWKGISGNYIIKIDNNSEIVDGKENGLPTLIASVGAFTRMWLGVRSATSLSVTDDLSAPKELFNKLDGIFRLPTPKADWDF